MVKKLIISSIIAAVSISACTTQNPYTGDTRVSKTAAWTAVGTMAGAFLGAATSSKKDRKKAALIGAGIGALSGAAVGSYMDKQDAKLRDELRSTGVSVQKVGNEIILLMPGDITFAVNSSDISSDFYSVLNSVTKVLKEYNKTYVEVTGHTDSTGSADYNQRLSVDRATSVAKYLMGRGVESERFFINGMGESRPIASNATTTGRAQNRRVEIKLSPITN